MNIQLGGLETGKYRKITLEEWRTLNELIKDSSNETVVFQKERTGGGSHGR